MYRNVFIDQGDSFSRGTVHVWDDEQGHITLPWSQFDYAYKPSAAGTYLSMTGVRLSKVKKFDRDDDSLFESDLPRETRVLTDLYLSEDRVSTGHVVMFTDIEVSMENGLPNTDSPNNEITAISLYDTISKLYRVLVLDKSGTRENVWNDNVQITFYKTELDLLYAFLTMYEEINPTIISGWNSDYFDIPYLYNRLKQKCGENTANRLSPIGRVKYSKFKNKLIIAGVSSLDYLDLYRKFTYIEQPNYRLGTIGRIEVKLDKIEFEGTLDDLFHNDLDTYIKYNLRDTEILVELDKKLKLIELVRGICHLGHVPYEDYGFSSRFLEGTIVTYLHRKGIIVTNKPAGYREMMQERDESDEDGFDGAFVKEPVPGLYEWIYSLDLQSLYPSIIMSLNISPETKLGVVLDYDIQAHLDGKIQEYRIQEKDKQVTKLSRADFLQYLEDEKLYISSNGVLYTSISTGIIPEVLDVWFAQRLEFKNLMKKYSDEGNAELTDFYDRRQHIQKIFLNSLYGTLGLPSFRFYDLDNALAVTASGQDVIKRSADFVNGLYQRKLSTTEDYCTYIDTDSLYFSSSPVRPAEKDAKQFTIDIARAMEAKLNSYYDELALTLFRCKQHRLYIKGESIASAGIWIAKKRYALNTVYDLEKNKDLDNKMKVKGLDVVRSSFPQAFRQFMTDIMKKILNRYTKDQIDALVLEFRTKLDSMHYLDVARNTSVKNVEDYDTGTNRLNDFQKGSPAHVKAALTYNALLAHFGLESKYPKIQNGEKIKWIYLKQNPLNLATVALKGDNDPAPIIEFATKYIDYDALFEKELQSKLEDFYAALGWGLLPTEVNQNFGEWFV